MGALGDSIIEYSKVVSSILTLITFVGFVIKPIRKKIVNWIRNSADSKMIIENAQQLKEINEKMTSLVNESEASKANDLCMIRHAITEMYYDHIGDDTMRAREKEDLEFLYERYEKLGGNSYVRQIVKELREKTTVE